MSADDRDWMTDAVCATAWPDDWFPENGHAPKAQKICATCPVATQCLEYAIAEHISWGIWGGVGPRRRNRIGAAA